MLNLHNCQRFPFLVTLLTFLQSLHLSVQLNVSISVISSTSYSCFAYWYYVFYVCKFLNFIFYFKGDC